jgi:hypothetical protein
LFSRLSSSIARISDYRESFEPFFNSFFLYYRNFPTKNQSKDNKRSIFDEHSFKYLPADYQSILGSEIGETRVESNGSVKLDEMLEIQRPRAENVNFLKNEEETQELRLNRHFKYLALSHEEITKILNDQTSQDLCNFLNTQIANFVPNCQMGDVLNLAYRDHSIFTYTGPVGKVNSVRMITRNMTGRFAWEFRRIISFNKNITLEGGKKISDILESNMRLKQSRPSHEKMGTEYPEVLDLDEVAGNDIFEKISERVKEYTDDFKEFDFSSMLKIKRKVPFLFNNKSRHLHLMTNILNLTNFQTV